MEAAGCATLNALARAGKTGCAVVAPGVAPESDVGVLAVLGFNPFEYRVGRGVLEALGSGMKFKNGWLAFRANFATADADGGIIDRRAGRTLSTQEAKALERDLNKRVKLEGAGFEFKATMAHRGVLVLKPRDGRLSKNVSNTDPAYERISGLGSAVKTFSPAIAECKALDSTQEAREAARLANGFSREAMGVLGGSAVNKARGEKGLLPANAVLLRDAESELRKPPSQRKGWTILAGMPLERGIGELVGMRVSAIGEPPATPQGFASLARKALAEFKKLRAGGGLYVHVKGPDLFGHDGDARGKARCLKEIDEFFLKPLAKAACLLGDAGKTPAAPKARILVTGDHATPCVEKAHSADSVPFLLSGGGVEADGSGANGFGETQARKRPAVKMNSLFALLEQKA